MIVLDGFNPTTGYARDGYELCVRPCGSGSKDESSSILLDISKSKAEDSWILVPESGSSPERGLHPAKFGWMSARYMTRALLRSDKRELAESLGELNDTDDPEELWTVDSKTKILKVT